MSERLFVMSFHSVKGGVGKSTLATLTAIGAARRNPAAEVWLVDMDLTGTSLGDGLPLRAPVLGEPMDLHTSSTPSFYSLEETRRLIEERGNVETGPACVPYLNDYLLFAGHDWDPNKDADPRAFGWSLEGGPGNMKVIPSSALPRDLVYTLPVIFDEEYAAFLEARLELFLAALLTKSEKDVWVIFDVPPTIPGLSRAMIGMGIRLGRLPEDRVSLATSSPWIPPPLDKIPLSWRCHLVGTMDPQDLRATARWANLISPPDLGGFRAIFNRVEPSVKAREGVFWNDLLSDYSPFPELWSWESSPVRLLDSPDLRVFQGNALAVSAAVDELLRDLLDGFGAQP